MPFEQALTAGKAQLFERKDELGFALDITVAHRYGKEAIDIDGANSIASERQASQKATVDTKHGKASVAAEGESEVRLEMAESEHGVKVYDAKDSPALIELPIPVSPALKPLKGFIGRSRERSIIEAATQDGETVGAFAEPGWGKTALLKNIAYSDTDGFPHGVVYLKVRQQPFEDVLQDLHDAFYRADEPAKPSESTIKQRLKDKEALIILDDVGLDAETVEDVENTLPKSSFVIST